MIPSASDARVTERAAKSGLSSIASGAVYARYGEGVYYMMAAMAGAGAGIMWLARHKLTNHPQSFASGG